MLCAHYFIMLQNLSSIATIIGILGDIGTFLMALFTLFLAYFTRNMAIATSESHIMPKIVHNMRGKENNYIQKGPLISFDFYNNRPLFPEITVKIGCTEVTYKSIQGDIEVLPGKTQRDDYFLQFQGRTQNLETQLMPNMWHVSLPDSEDKPYILKNIRCVDEYLDEYFNKNENNIKIRIDVKFTSYSGREYIYTYELNIKRNDKGKLRYYVERTKLIDQKLPWESQIIKRVIKIAKNVII